mmetsp:Transcript_8712/g.14776  ORF Transcript_8712/g.14776 Transcript_8712/m.14776 type:complete len:161 (+) Transcript_8712:608-1090(+)
MFFKFCSDNVARVGQASCSALADILEKYEDDEPKLNGIIKVVKKRYFFAKTFKKRQLFVKMCGGKLMQKKELFEKHFKYEFLSLVNDRVPNVRIGVAKELRHHFLKEISGAFVYDQEMNDAVQVLKQDKSMDVVFQVQDIETYQQDETRVVDLDSFVTTL